MPMPPLPNAVTSAATSFLSLLALTACSASDATTSTTEGASQSSASNPSTARDPLPPATIVQRVTTAVPWPRGAVWNDGKLWILARGVHRSAGGPNPDIQDLAGNIFEVDPNIHEPVEKGVAPSDAVRTNGRVIAEATSPPFRLWTRQMPVTSDTLTDRPYAGLLHDPISQSLFVICFSGIDIEAEPRFRKNATDAVHRFSLKTGKWYPFESHDHTRVPVESLGKTVAVDTYPHHDPAKNAPPHGLANGPCGGWIVGRYLYITAKDNSALIQYDLDEVRKNPDAGAANGRYVFHRASPKDDPFLRTKSHGMMYVEGPGAVTTFGDQMYVAFRTTSQVVRFPITKDGDVVRPIVAEYLAQFDPYEKDGEGYTTTPDFFDMRADSTGRIFLSCNQQGAIWEIPTDPSRFLDARKGTKAQPYVNLRKLTPHERSTAGNFVFDPNDNLYICTGNKDLPEGNIRGAVYRVPRR
jgi:hypothetical protein